MAVCVKKQQIYPLLRQYQMNVNTVFELRGGGGELNPTKCKLFKNVFKWDKDTIHY